MSYVIRIQNLHSYPIPSKLLTQSVKTMLQLHEIDVQSELSIVITDEESVRKLNKQHRHIDAPTDILSFPADPLPDFVTDEPPYLGDLIIAFPYAEAQATAHHHTLNDSLCLLVIHGTLHLLGYNHDTPENRAEMWSVQEEALHKLGIDTSIVPSLESYIDD